MAGNLYVVATPIGNLGDFSTRAIEILKSVDLIAAEDTRNTMKLLAHFDIHTPMTANHKFNELQAVNRLVAELENGKNIAVVSDAGTPCINDPGYILVREASKAGITVYGIPGACAAATAVSASGLPSDTFCFMGFFPREKKETESLFEYMLKNRKELYIFYESPKRIKDTLEWFVKKMPTAQICLCNDLTKAHERLYRGTPSEVFSLLMANPNAEKGEYAMVVYYEPVASKPTEEQAFSLEALLIDELVKTGCTLKEAIATVTVKTGLSKKDVYQASLRLKELQI